LIEIKINKNFIKVKLISSPVVLVDRLWFWRFNLTMLWMI